MKHLFYALGGGLGHFRRASRILEHYEIKDPVVLLVSPHLKEWNFQPPSGNVELQFLPEACVHSSELTRRWFDLIFASSNFDQLWLDAFPFGLFGEFQNGLPKIPVNYIARILKSSSWMEKNYPICFSNTWLVEDLTEKHLEFIENHSETTEHVDLLPAAKNPSCLDVEPVWLLTHTGNQEEVDELVALTCDAPAVLSATAHSIKLPDHFIEIDSPVSHYHLVERIITGCGFNTMLETSEFHSKHTFIPFERKFDDQFLRAELRRRRFS